MPAAIVHAQAPSPDDYRIVQKVPREEFDRWLKEEIARSGGEMERQRYQFVIGFSTGHYGSDPVHAIAMRRLAFSLLNNTLAAGDRVIPVAWEMQVWQSGKPIELTADSQSRAALVDAVPYAPMEGSRGGHDTERALFETLTNVVPKGQAKHTVVLLLTNTNQSQGPTGERATLFGANNRQLASAVQQLGYRTPVRHSFAAQAKGSPLTIDVTALFPKQLAAYPGAPSSSRFPTFALETWQPPADRPDTSDPLPNDTAAPGSAGSPSGAPAPASGTAGAGEAPGAGERQNGFPWPLLILGLLILAGIVFWLMRRGKKPQPAKQADPPLKGKPLPGSIKATLGSAPNSSTKVLTGLTSVSRWDVVDPGDGRVRLSDEETPEGTRLASLALDERRRLTLQSEPDVLLQGVTGVKADAANPRQLILQPGDHVVCRVASAGTARQPIRLELAYQEKG